MDDITYGDFERIEDEFHAARTAFKKAESRMAHVDNIRLHRDVAVGDYIIQAMVLCDEIAKPRSGFMTRYQRGRIAGAMECYEALKQQLGEHVGFRPGWDDTPRF